MALDTRKIIHIDMDCFYASVEMRDDPSLKGRPVAVGGRAEGRGVLTTANYEARRFGVRSAMSTAKALRLCPDLILIPVHFEKYKAESRRVRSILERFSNRIEPLSLDEAYLDVTGSPFFNGSATRIATEIREIIFQETGLTASAGVAPNKFLAKVASDWKKPNGQFTISPAMVSDFVRHLPVERIPGVGKVTSEKMHRMGLKTCADLQTWSIQKREGQFGSWALRLFDLSRGVDRRSVSCDREHKSSSVETTFASDLRTLGDCLKEVPKLYRTLCERLVRMSQVEGIRSAVVKMKFHDFQRTTAEKVSDGMPAVEDFLSLAEHAFLRRSVPVRLIGVGVKYASERKRRPTSQLNLLSSDDDAAEHR